MISPGQPDSTVLIENAVIYTMDPAKPRAEALALRNGHILAAGAREEVARAAGGDAYRVDLGRKAVIPGLYDAHIHCMSYSRSLAHINLDGVTSKEEVLRIVAEKARQTPPGEWVLGGGWNNNLWSPPDFPTRHDLDRAAPNNPVYLDRKDLHSCWINTAALTLTGVTRDSPDPPGARIGRDSNGEPDGLFFESAVSLAAQAVKSAGESPVVTMLRGIRALNSMGIVGFHNAMGQDPRSDLEGSAAFEALQELDRTGTLTARVVSMIPHYNLRAAMNMGLKTGFGSERLRVGPVKMFSDGSLGSMTAEMLEPYEGNPGYTGIRTVAQEELERDIADAARAGIPSAVHAIGDDANRRVLDALAKAGKVERGDGKGAVLPHRIEHVQLLHPDDIPRFAQLGVAASMQPTHATSDMHAADRLWGARSRYSYAWRSVLDSGALLAFGSDAPVETPNPFAGIHAAVTRQDGESQPEGGWYPEERLSVEEAVRAYTVGAVQSAPYLPGVTGTLVPGSAADLLVLDRDIFAVDPSEIRDARPLATIVGGEVVYGAIS